MTRTKPSGRVGAHSSLVLVAPASVPGPKALHTRGNTAPFISLVRPSVSVSVACSLVPDSFIC